MPREARSNEGMQRDRQDVMDANDCLIVWYKKAIKGLDEDEDAVSGKGEREQE